MNRFTDDERSTLGSLRRSIAVLAFSALLFSAVAGPPSSVAAVDEASTNHKSELLTGTQTFENTASITIDNVTLPPTPASVYPSTIEVTGPASTVVTKVVVDLIDLTHTWPDDIDILLEGPGGERSFLMSETGGANSLANTNVTFDQDAASDLPDEDPFTSGTFRPTNYLAGDNFPAPGPGNADNVEADLDVYKFTDPVGTWKLFIVDDASGDVGEMAGGWSLTITSRPLYTVTKVADTNDGVCDADCSLREAIDVAAEGGVIAFASPLFDAPRTITLGGTELEIDKGLIINAPGADLLTVSGNSMSRVIDIGAGFDVEISGITITGGSAATDGGGISNKGNLTISNSTITNNSAVMDGGGIDNGDLGNLSIENSTIDNNSASGSGGGIFNNNDGILTVTNSTISTNSASLGGGGIAQDSNGSTDLLNTTVANNMGGTSGGGILQTDGTVNFGNTIIARNSATAGPDILGTVNSLGFNLIEDVSGATVTGQAGSNMTNVNPRLAPLDNYGGTTDTLALLPNSPAIDAGCLPAPPTDQRGLLHADDGTIQPPPGCNPLNLVDIGSVDRQANDIECSFSISPTSTSVPASGDTGAIEVTDQYGCQWIAFSFAGWVTITSGSPGDGSGTVTYSVAPNIGPERNGTVLVAGRSFSVNQASGCTYSIDPTSVSIPVEGGVGSVEVTTVDGCEWTTVSNDSWITVTDGGSGSASGTVEYSVAANPGGPRSGTITIGGETFTVDQASDCSYVIDPISANADAAGGNLAVTVTTDPGCDWTAVSNDGWLTVTSGSPGNGSGTVDYSVDPNTGPARSGTITVAGATHTVDQADGCSFVIDPISANADAAGGNLAVTVTTDSGCDWTAVSNDGWLTVTSGSPGSGSGTVDYSVDPNTGPARSGTISVAGETHTVNQAAAATPSSTRFDLDGDGKTDIGIFRPGPGEWWYLRSSDDGNSAFQFGQSTDTMVPADYTGDGATDIAFWRESSGEWFVLRSEDSTFYAFPFGTGGDIPVPGDYDGDGEADPGVFRPSSATWFILNSGGGTTIQQFGLTGDEPIVEDYDGDGKDDIAVYRPGLAEWYMERSSDGFIGFQFGTPGDTTPAPADLTGDGKADVTFFKPSTGEWFVLRSEDSSFFAFPFGTGTDIPIPGDYDGDGTADPAVFRPSNNSWFLQQTTDGFEQVQFGIADDIPIPSAYIP